MSKLSKYLAQERKKIQEIPSNKQKATYIWTYYKLWIIGLVCAVWFLCFVVIQLTTGITENWIYMVFVGTNAEVGNGSDFWQGYLDATGYDTKQKNVQFDNQVYFDFARDRGHGNTYYEAFVAYADSGTLDAAVMQTDSLTLLGETGRLMDLNDPRCASIVEQYGDKLLYATPIDTEYSSEPVPVGIDISDSILMTEEHIYAETCALGISANSTHIEAVEQFLHYIYQEGAE